MANSQVILMMQLKAYAYCNRVICKNQAFHGVMHPYPTPVDIICFFLILQKYIAR